MLEALDDAGIEALHDAGIAVRVGALSPWRQWLRAEIARGIRDAAL